MGQQVLLDNSVGVRGIYYCSLPPVCACTAKENVVAVSGQNWFLRGTWLEANRNTPDMCQLKPCFVVTFSSLVLPRLRHNLIGIS